MTVVFNYIVYKKREVNGKVAQCNPVAGFQEKEDAQEYAADKNVEALERKSSVKVSFCIVGDGTEEIRQLQEEADRRTRIVKEAEDLIGQCKMQEAINLLSTL